MSSISISTLGMFDGPQYPSGTGGVIMREEGEIKRPGILVVDMNFKESKYKNLKEDFIKVKSVKLKWR